MLVRFKEVSECVDGNYLFQVVEEPTRKGAGLELVFTSKQALLSNVKLEGSFGCSDHKMMEFKILRVSKKVCSQLTTLDFKRAEFKLFRELHGRATWDKALERREAQDSSSVFKDHLLQAQKHTKKKGKQARMPEGLSGSTGNSFLDLLKHKKKVCTEWKQEWVTWDNYKEVV